MALKSPDPGHFELDDGQPLAKVVLGQVREGSEDMVQVEAPAELVFPVIHATQLVEPVEVEYVFAEHSVQLVEPVEAE